MASISFPVNLNYSLEYNSSGELTRAVLPYGGQLRWA
jgi:hypothetical protein